MIVDDAFTNVVRQQVEIMIQSVVESQFLGGRECTVFRFIEKRLDAHFPRIHSAKPEVAVLRVRVSAKVADSKKLHL